MLSSATSNQSTLVVGTSYLPSREYLICLSAAADVIIDADDDWKKQTVRNRTFILTPNGVQPLIIPVKHNNGQKTKTKDIRISYNEAWIRVHKGALLAAYNTSPNFEFLKDDLWRFYDRKYEFLVDLNTELTSWMLRKFKLSSTVKTGGVPEIAFDDKKSLCGLSDHSCIFMKENELKTYPQVFGYKLPFTANLSAFDMLCNVGSLY